MSGEVPEAAAVSYFCNRCPHKFMFTAHNAQVSIDSEREYKYFECERMLHDTWHKLLEKAGLPYREQP